MDWNKVNSFSKVVWLNLELDLREVVIDPVGPGLGRVVFQ